jgi:CheY-like chemotaxis protein
MNKDAGKGSPSVLVVEDEPLICDMVSETLTEAGFSVCTATTAAQALEQFDNGLDPDILFTDINLPGDMDGSALATRARSLSPNLVVVYVSGRFGAGTINAVPGSVFVPKPYSPLRMCSLLLDLAARRTSDRCAMA